MQVLRTTTSISFMCTCSRVGTSCRANIILYNICSTWCSNPTTCITKLYSYSPKAIAVNDTTG